MPPKPPTLVSARSALFRRLGFTLLIFGVVVLALAFPAPFRQVGGFALQRLIIPILMVIMFGMGSSMSLADFVGVIRMPRGVLVGVLCQFSLMPLVGYLLARSGDLPPEVAAGIILVGCSPSGLASNVMAYLARANLALSLTLTMVATLVAPLLTPALMKLLADQLVPVDFLGMMHSITQIVIIPVVAGLLVNHWTRGRWDWLQRGLTLVSMGGIALVIAIITAAGRDALLSIGLTLVLAVVMHNGLGYLLGYGASRLAGLKEADARTVALEVGMQNSGLASGIALTMGKVASMGLAPALFGPLMNVSGSALAAFWRSQPPQGSATQDAA